MTVHVADDLIIINVERLLLLEKIGLSEGTCREEFKLHVVYDNFQQSVTYPDRKSRDNMYDLVMKALQTMKVKEN